ncbi:hypothetical protein Tco_0637817 [Tanacetum coccineum]
MLANRKKTVCELLSLKDEGLLGQLECLGYPMPHELGTEKGLPKKVDTLVVLAIREGKIQKIKNKKSQGAKGKGKGKGKQVYAPKPKILPSAKKEHPTKYKIFHHCNKFATRILNMVPTKKVDKTSYEIWHGKDPNLSYLRVWDYEALNGLTSQEASVSNVDLKFIQDDTQPYENTCENHDEVKHESVEPSSGIVLIHRFARMPQAPDRYGLYVDAEEHELGDLNEPTNYTALMSDPKSDKWVKAMNAKMQSMKDNQV